MASKKINRDNEGTVVQAPPEQEQASAERSAQKADAAGPLQRAQSDPRSLSPQEVRQLQRTIGNQATGQMIQQMQKGQAPAQKKQTPAQKGQAPAQKVTDISVSPPSDMVPKDKFENSRLPDGLGPQVEPEPNPYDAFHYGVQATFKTGAGLDLNELTLARTVESRTFHNGQWTARERRENTPGPGNVYRDFDQQAITVFDCPGHIPEKVLQNDDAWPLKWEGMFNLELKLGHETIAEISYQISVGRESPDATVEGECRVIQRRVFKTFDA